MQVDLTLSIVHDDHTHLIGGIQIHGINISENEIITKFSQDIIFELKEITDIANLHKNDMRTLLPLLTLRSITGNLTQLATTIFLISKKLDLEHTILIIECNGITKTINTTQPRYS